MQYRALTYTAEAVAYVEECIAAPTVIGVDTETTGLRKWHDTIVGLCLSHTPGTGVYIPIAHDAEPNVDFVPLAEAVRRLLQIPKKIALHHAAYDGIILARGFDLAPITVGQAVYADVMLSALCIGERRAAGTDSSAGLKELSEKYLGVVRPHYKDLFPPKTPNDKMKFATLDVDLATPYAAADADDTLRLVSVLDPILDQLGVRQTYDLEMMLLPEVLWMESRGMMIDHELAAAKVQAAEEFAEAVELRVKRELGAKLGRDLTEVDKKGNPLTNLNSTDQLAYLLHTPPTGLNADERRAYFPKPPSKAKNPKPIQPLPPGLGLPIVAKTASGFPQVDEKALNKLAKYDPAVAWLLEARGARKVAGTYFGPFPEHANEENVWEGAVGVPRKILHPSYAQFGTETGRWSCSEPNVQNVPKGAEFGEDIPEQETLLMNGRDIIVARPGYYLVDGDWSQVEYRIICGMSQDPALVQVFRDKVDLHIGTASAMFGVPLAEVTKAQRSDGKTINYALNFGAGVGRLAEMLGCSKAEAEEKTAIYNAAFPYVIQMKKGIEEFAYRHRYVETIFGRKRWFDFNGGGSEAAARKAYFAAMREAVNMPVQGTAADLLKIMLVRLGPWLREHFPEVRTIASTHDSVTFEVPDTIPPEVFTEAVRPIMEFPWDFVPGYPEITCDFETGQRWGSLEKLGHEDEPSAAAPLIPEVVGKRVGLWIGRSSLDPAAAERLRELAGIIHSLGKGPNRLELSVDALAGEVSILEDTAFGPDMGHLVVHLFADAEVRDLGSLLAAAVGE